MHVVVVATRLREMSCSQHGYKLKIFKTKKKKKKKITVLVQSPHMHTLSLRTLPEDDHGANCQSAGSQIDLISFFPLLQRTVCWVTCAPQEVPLLVF